MAGSWRESLIRRRWWLIALAFVILVRMALPEVLRRVIESQASETLNARVNVGDVDLRLWRGGVALEDVAVREKGAPEAPPPPEKTDRNAPPPPAFDDYSPVVAFKRFAVELHYLPLFHKTIQLRDIAFESPRVALDRLASGDLNVMALVPKQQVAVQAGATPAAVATPTAAPAAAEPPGEPWKVGLDKFVLSDGRIRFRDLAVEGSEPIELGIDRISVDEVALSPAVYGKPGRIHLKLGVDEGVVDVDAQVTLDGANVSVSTDVTANSLPLRRARLYVPNVGWSELKGELDLGLTYELVPEKTNALHGTVGLREVAVAVPGLEDVAVGWKSLAVTLERIDLLEQRAAVQKVALDGASVTLRALGETLPVIARKGAAATPAAPPQATAAATATGTAAAAPPAATGQATPVAEASATPLAPTPQPTAAAEAEAGTATASPTSTPTQSGAPAGTASPAASPASDAKPKTPAKPWGWQVSEVAITNSSLHVLSDGPPQDVGVEIAAKNLSGDDGAVAHVTLGLAYSPGSIALDGDLRIAPSPAFGGTLKIAEVSLPAIPSVRIALPPEVFPSGILRSDLTIAAGLPAASGGEASADQVRLSGTLGVGALKLSPPAVPGLSLDMEDVELRIDRLIVPGVLPPGQKAAAGAAIDLAAGLKLRAPHVTRTGEQALAVAAQTIALEVPSLTVPASLAGLAPGDGVPIVSGGLGLDLQAPSIGLGNDDMTVQAQTLSLKVTDAALPVQPPAPKPASAAPVAGGEEPVAVVAAAAPVSAGPAKLGLQLDVSQLAVATVQKKELNVAAQAIALKLDDVVVPGFVAGAPLAPSSEPLQAKATLLLTQPRVTRAEGKEFAVSAKSISVPLQSISLPGVPGGMPPGAALQPLRAVLGEIRIEAPAIRATRRKEGIVLPAMAASASPAKTTPSAAPTPAAQATPAAKQPLELQVAALRVTRGGLEFTDHAVDPVFSTRFAPIEIDARNIQFPGPQVKQLNIDITCVEQGKITVRGNVAPDASTLTLKVDQLALAPFNPYATTYSSYSIADGSLSIETKADAHGGKYDVKNNITLHQFDLAGAEGDSLFEQNFGISLSMALALLRDIQGNIGLSVPLQVDREGNAQVDVMGVVRSALRQAITGAVTSPLKMLGAVAGGKGAPVAPAPVAFRLGRAEPTSAGAESADHLAAFLVSRPGMGVELWTAATADDARWIQEHKLLGEWADEGVFRRSLAFVTSRGPRQRIHAYLEARADDKKPELSAEDAATLDEWLAERPAPTEEELQALADARLTAVESVLHAKGIDASRVNRGKPPELPELPKSPIVGTKLRAAKPAAEAEPGGEASPETGDETGR